MRRAIVVQGLGFGDEGKGSCTEWLCKHFGADLCVRYSGGAQAGHNIQLKDGTRHTFSQFGCGHFQGVPTYLGPQVVIDPLAMKWEYQHLQAHHPKIKYNKPSYHPDCLVATKYHRALNRLKEISRGNDRHGSCGMGIGETRSYWLRYGSDAITAWDLVGHNFTELPRKLELLRQRVMLEVGQLPHLTKTQVQESGVLDGPFNVRKELKAAMASCMGEHSSSIWDRDSIKKDPMWDTIVVFEGAQGVLIDETWGFHPHTTWSTVTPRFALEMVRENGFDEICVIGVTRSYLTRHGAGPLSTYDKELTERLKDPGNPDNEWQGGLRCGWLDLGLLRYAVEACGGVDCLAVNHLDQMDENFRLYDLVPRWHSRESWPTIKNQEYLNGELRDFEGQIKWRPYTGWETVRSEAAKTDMVGLLKQLSAIAPVAIVGHGPTADDRELVAQLPFRKVEK